MKTTFKAWLIISTTTLCLLLFAAVGMSQIDSAAIQHGITTGVQIIGAAGGTIIPNIPNEITGSVITLIAGFVIRFFEKRKLKRQGKLIS